ncbi:uncharacterized protein J3D65DRAFT_621238 [Phyllosticta citribraziliensis]|uniref:Uncharacterized protein n=1 Tax=Phyllosticta citribraziliensis TaxID=989973 RepID=A0ABR1LVS9_9PEZI
MPRPMAEEALQRRRNAAAMRLHVAAAIAVRFSPRRVDVFSLLLLQVMMMMMMILLVPGAEVAILLLLAVVLLWLPLMLVLLLVRETTHIRHQCHSARQDLGGWLAARLEEAVLVQEPARGAGGAHFGLPGVFTL